MNETERTKNRNRKWVNLKWIDMKTRELFVKKLTEKGWTDLSNIRVSEKRMMDDCISITEEFASQEEPAKDLLIEKLLEKYHILSCVYENRPHKLSMRKIWLENISKIKIEIASMLWSLEKQVEDYPVYDENYLNDCIKRATPGLSKIKDVQKWLDELRGREPHEQVEPNNNEK